jgi:hypothetical protein
MTLLPAQADDEACILTQGLRLEARRGLAIGRQLN